MISTRSQIDKIIITAMDRFVWFVLLVVMSHLVTEFTRVTGYARGNRHEVLLVNDSLLQPMSVQNMVLYPGNDYGLYERPSAHYASNAGIEPNAAFIVGTGNSAGAGGASASGSNAATSNNNEQGFSLPFFSFRPLIDSIFEIPISTLRAVNNLVARLTGSYRQATPSDAVEKSANAVTTLPTAMPTAKLRLPTKSNTVGGGGFKRESTSPIKDAAKKSVLREEVA